MRTGFLLVFVVLVALVVLFGCNGEKDCPECEPCMECEPGYHLECVKDPGPPPPEPPGPQPEDYITLARAGELTDRCITSTGLLGELCFDEQELIWDGVRNPEYAAAHCCADLPGIWAYTCDDLKGVIVANRLVHSRLLGFMDRLQTEHEEFSGRTIVRKARFEPFRDELEDVLAVAAQLNGIRGWCEGLR